VTCDRLFATGPEVFRTLELLTLLDAPISGGQVLRRFLTC
jgi:hypothetical protein